MKKSATWSLVIVAAVSFPMLGHADYKGHSMANDQYLHARHGGPVTTANHDWLTSPDGNYVLVMQEDCNLVLYHGYSAIWASNTTGCGNGVDPNPNPAGTFCDLTHDLYAVMQRDGNLVIYADYYYQPCDNAFYPAGDSFKAIWASNTRGSNFRLDVQNDGNTVIYLNSTGIWSTNTHGR